VGDFGAMLHSRSQECSLSHIGVGSKKPVSRRQMLAHDVLVERDAEAGFVGHRDEAFVDDGLFDAFHQILPPGDIQRVILACQEILGRGGAVHAGQRADRQAGIVHGHRDSVFHGGVADLMGLEDAAGGGDIRMNLADCVLLAQVDETFLQVDIFAGENGRGALHGDVLEKLGVLPGNHILHPGKVVFLVGLSRAG
jgi:hypothetical protein